MESQTIKTHHRHQTSADYFRGISLDQNPEEENEQIMKLPLTPRGRGRGTQCPELLTRASSSSLLSSSSSSSLSPPRDFSFTDDDENNGNSLLLSAAQAAVAVEMASADDIFFHGHLLPLHLLSHFSSHPHRKSSDCSDDCFALPIEGDGRAMMANEETSGIHSIRGKDKNSKPLWPFGLPRRRRASKAGGDEGNQDKQKWKFRLELNRAVKRYVRMARPLFIFRRKRDAGVQPEPRTYLSVNSRGTGIGTGSETGEMFSAPASVRTSPRNSGLPATRPTLSAGVPDSTAEELQAAIQAAIAYCKKSITAEADEEKKLRT